MTAEAEHERPPEPGDRRFTDKGVVLVFDGERWAVDPAFPGDGEGTPIREDD
ncbi:hypothetical protein [Saccharothrix sp. ALI-22-I]|uniref:hypothetical protein n=1 Tax=Saccharothrix sp. ALI-22-I TaxID=1933778 RepID=UPI0015C3A6F2|nr:hypothetical protein [Saccharothrix sp. ALI-22-I]